MFPRGRPGLSRSTTVEHSMCLTCHRFPQTSHSVDTADDDVALVVPLLWYSPGRTIVVQPDSPCAVLRNRRRARPHRRRSSLDASRHGREWADTHLGFCCARALRACGDTRTPRRRVEARVRVDHDAPFAGRRGCSTVSLLLHTRHAADADVAEPNHHRTTPLLPVARRWVACYECYLARTLNNVANSQCCHAVSHCRRARPPSSDPPILLFRSWEDPQQAVHHAVEPVHLTIPSGVVRSGM